MNEGTTPSLDPASPVHPRGGVPDRAALSDFDAGRPDDPGAALASAHVEGCEQCQAVLSALRAVRADLRLLGATPMPAAVADRVAAALAAEPRSVGDPAAAGEPDGGRHRAAQVIELRSARRVRRLRVAAGLAAGIVLLGGGGYLLSDITGGTSATTSAVGDAAEEAAPGVADSDGSQALPSYDRQSLEAAVGELLAEPLGTPAQPSTSTDEGGGIAVEPECLTRIPMATSQALAIVRAIYEGRPAIVVLFPGEPGQVQVTVLSDCAQGAVPAVVDEFPAER